MKRRFRITGSTTWMAVLGAYAVVLASAATAAPLIYEGFDTPATGPLNGQGGVTSSGWAGNWSATPSTSSAQVVPDSLEPPATGTEFYNATRASNHATATGAQSGIRMADASQFFPSTVWGSFVARVAAAPNSSASVQFATGGGGVLTFSATNGSQASPVWRASDGTTNFSSNTPFKDATLIIFRIDFDSSNGQDRLQVWFNANPATALPEMNGFAAFGSAGLQSITFAASGQNGGSTIDIDEIRMGTSLGDVCRGPVNTTNLLQNPDAESGVLSPWASGGDANPFVDSGSFDPAVQPHSGKYDFVGGTGAASTLTQRVVLVGLQGLTETDIDSGNLNAVSSFWQQSLSQGTPSDEAAVFLTFYDANGSPISAGASPRQSSTGAWTHRVDGFPIPFGTRSIDYAMDFTLNRGTDLDAFIDDNSLIVASRKPPVIISPASMTVTEGVLFSYQIVATGQPMDYSSDNIPAGCVVDSKSGMLTGRLAAGTYNTFPGAFSPLGSAVQKLTITVLPAPSSGPVITSGTSATARVGQPFTFQVTTRGGTAAARLSASGLPAGLSFDDVTGVISGTPTAEGSTGVTLTVTDGGLTATATLELTVVSDPEWPVIASPNTVLFSSGQPIVYKIAIGSGTSEPPVFELAGDLPAGLGFDPSTGTISGTVSAIGAANGRRNRGPGGTDLSGGVVTNVQLIANNSHGTGTLPLIFFVAPSGVVNISTRIPIGTGENVLIGGFIITGNAPKKVIVRAVGPSLKVGDTPVAGTLQDPTLELHQGDGALLGSDDDWRASQEQEIIDTTVPPADPREAAIVATLQPGNYTAIVAGKNGETGIGLVEVYDLGTASLEASSNAKLANISTRGFVQTSDNVMIGGFIVTGGSSKVIVRAIGPELTGRGVAGALEDTTLELRDGNGALINANDDWRAGSQEQQIIDTTVPPTDDRESAIVATLTNGGYTAVVRGKDGATGVGLVEVYILQ